MIEINLIPKEQRKRKKGQVAGGLSVSMEVIIGAIGGILLLVLVLDGAIFALNTKKISAKKTLDAEWKEIEPARQNVEGIVEEMRRLQNKSKDIESITQNQMIVWSQKLNIISNSLPRGVWLTKISLTDEAFFVQGSAVSKDNREMSNIHAFAAELKDDENFLQDLETFDLGSIQRKKLYNTEVTNFVITMILKQEQEEDE